MTYADLVGGVDGSLYGHNYHSLAAAALQASHDGSVGGRVRWSRPAPLRRRRPMVKATDHRSPSRPLRFPLADRAASGR